MLKDDERKPDAPAGAAGRYTRLGASAFINGELSGDEDVTIEGRFQGKINLERHNLTIARGARVEAEVSVKNLVLQGELTGNARATEKVLVTETGQMKGDVAASRISIMDGAQFRGMIKMEKPGAASPQPPTPPQS